MPFGSFQVSDEEAMHNAIRFMKEAGADAVKLEGAGPMLSRVQALVGGGIPVMGHLGLTPQSATMLGGFKAQGRTAEKALRLFDDALALEAAGCFAIVLEAVPAPVAARITEALAVPTIGIGAGAACDGQVLVWHDLLGLYEGHAPRFVKQYADLAAVITRGGRQRTSRTCASTASRRSSTRTRCRRTSSRSSRRRYTTVGRYESAARKSATSPSAASERHQLHPCTARMPTSSNAADQTAKPSSSRSKTRPAAPSSEPKRRNRSVPKSASWTGQSRNRDNASGATANPRMCRARWKFPCAAEPSRPQVESAADDEVAGERDDAAGDQRPDRDQERVVLQVVVERARGTRSQRDGDPRQADEREHGLRTGLHVLARVVPQGDEDRPRREEDGGNAEPPLAVGIHVVTLSSRRGRGIDPDGALGDAVRGDARDRAARGVGRRGAGARRVGGAADHGRRALPRRRPDGARRHCRRLLCVPEPARGSSATATIESKTNFFAAVRSGTVEARSRPLHRGSRTIVVETDLFDEAGKHVARVTQTQAVL